jgi:hypothetical protein
LTLLYLGASLFVTISNETIAQIFELRSRNLAAGLNRILELDKLRKSLSDNAAFKGLLDATARVGSYIDSNVLAQVLTGSLKLAAGPGGKSVDLLAAIDQLPDSQVKSVLLTLKHGCADDIGQFTKSLGEWIDKSLTVAGESYKRNIVWLSFGLGIFVAVAFNIDTLRVTERLYQDKDLRDQATMMATTIVQSATPELPEKCAKLKAAKEPLTAECETVDALLNAVAKRNDSLGKLPIGWNDWTHFSESAIPGGNWDWVRAWVGWLLTAMAVSLGAPFWFDLLNKLVNVRHGIRPTEAGKK